MMRKAPTIRDVAARAGVSVAVVSRVINDGTGPVAPATRARVVEVIDELGYRPRLDAKSLSAGNSGALGLILADLANPFFARLADRIVLDARSKGMQVVLMTTQEDETLEAEALDALLDRSVSVVIATPTGANIQKWQRLIELGIDVVFVDRSIAALPQVDVVSIENTGSAEIATEHLVKLGHTRIGFISGPLATSTGTARVMGYQNILKAHELPIDPELIHAVPFRGNGGSDAVGALLGLKDPPTALIVANTGQVPSAVRRLFQSIVDIPDQLSLVVFDDNPWTELVTPPLTVIRQPIDMLALHSVDLAIGRARGTLPVGQRTISVPADFAQRSSSTSPKPVILAQGENL
jgi:LacI family transcriptional regulator